MVVPSLSSSLCMVSGPGALPLLRNLTNLMRVGAYGAQSTQRFLSAKSTTLGPMNLCAPSTGITWQRWVVASFETVKRSTSF